jgi:hypothetical protein
MPSGPQARADAAKRRVIAKLTTKPWPASPPHHISPEGLAALEPELRALETEASRAIAERIPIEHQELPAYRQDF